MSTRQSRAVATTVQRELAVLAEIALRLSRECHSLAARVDALRDGAHVQDMLSEQLDSVDLEDVRRALSALGVRLRQVRTHQRSIATTLSHVQFALQCSIAPS